MAPPKTGKPKDASFYIALLSLILTVVGIPIMFLSWVEPHLENDQKNQISIEVGNQLRDPLSKMTEANTHLAKIEGSLEDLKPFVHDVIAHQFENISKLPPQAIGSRLSAVKDLFAAAKNQNAELNSKLVTETGLRLIKNPSRIPNVWEAALEFLNYKSFTNKVPQTINTLKQYPNVTTHYFAPDIPPQEAPYLHFFGVAPSANAARLNPIGNDQNANLPIGAAILLADGGRMVIDGMDIRNVVFRNVEIDYSGGATILTNVTFINCTFKMVRTSKAQEFASALLSSDISTTFSG
jgi:hypothetical protein